MFSPEKTSIVGFFPFDECSAGKDLSGVDGNNIDSLQWARFLDAPENSPYGSLYLDGSENNRVTIPNNGKLDVKYSLTFTFWMYMDRRIDKFTRFLGYGSLTKPLGVYVATFGEILYFRLVGRDRSSWYPSNKNVLNYKGYVKTVVLNLNYIVQIVVIRVVIL